MTPLRLLTGLLGLGLLATTALAAEKVVLPWSFKPLKRPAPPAVDGAADDLDRFLIARLQAEGLAFAPPADRATLIRRATLDLHGLLPAPQEVEAFVRDPRADGEAFAAVLDRLLQSPRFGERWARH